MVVLADMESALSREIELVLILSAGVLFTLIVCLTGMLRKTATTRQREQTKRELAAYVAEGSMTPEDAHKILCSDQNEDACELVLKRAADGWMTAKKADQLIAAMEKRKSTKA